MTDPNGHARRISMSYILGFSDKPFKDPPPPPPVRSPKPNALMQMITTPGGIVEWVASDGRKGKLTGSGRQRLTAASPTKVPSVEDAPKKASTKGDSSPMGDMFNLFGGEGDNDKKSVKRDKDMGYESPGWHKIQDARLMELKSENTPWNKIAEEVGKNQEQCKQRFKEIKPKNWRPNAAKKGQGGGGESGQKRQENNQSTWNQNNGDHSSTNRKERHRDGTKKNKASTNDPVNDWGNANTAWDTTNNTTWNQADANPGVNAWGGGDKFENTNSNADGKNNETAATAWGDCGWAAVGKDSGDAANAWDIKPADSGGWDTIAGTGANVGGGGDATATAWDSFPTKTGDLTMNQGNNNNGSGDPWNTGGGDTWNASGGGAWDISGPTQTAPKKPPTAKAASRRSARPTASQNIMTAPLEVELRPDDVFSADDLRLVARILHQDCGLVWNRVSWRFRDKTGRTLHPDVFERKITGVLEGKSSDKGEKRRK